jgi:hypothetical protein
METPYIVSFSRFGQNFSIVCFKAPTKLKLCGLDEPLERVAVKPAVGVCKEGERAGVVIAISTSGLP